MNSSLISTNMTTKIYSLKYLVLAFLLLPLITFGQTKRALIVAIGNYPAETKWRPINSLNDVPLIQSALEIQGFNDFVVLRDAEADKVGIVKAMKDLENKSEKGDILVIHFSSHGQKMADDNGDELDGYDEGIVAYGGPGFFTPDYKDENHLRDDQIEQLIDNLRLKVGPTGDVLMIADACHSGTISRGEISRGGMPPLEDPAHPPMARGQEDVGLFQQTTLSRGSASDKSPFVLISASQASEVNYEYNGAGSLSTAISRCSKNIRENATYRSFFAQLLKEMAQIAPNQVPAIEGDIDRNLFGGLAVEQDPFYVPSRIDELSMNLRGGSLSGLYNDTEIAVYPAGTIHAADAEPLATGVIINAQNIWSKVKLDKVLTGNPADYWVFVTKQSYGDMRVKISIDTDDKLLNTKLMADLGELPLAQIVTEGADFSLVANPVDGCDIIRTSDQSVFAEGLSTDDGSQALKDGLINLARGNYFRDLELKYSSINVTFEFIPIHYKEDEFGGSKITDTLTMDEFLQNGVMVVNDLIGVHIVVTNHGTSPVYFSIIDIQPNGEINGILPDPDVEMGHTAEQFKIPPKTTFSTPDHYVTFGPPYGLEVFKLFASKKPIDFRPILSNVGTRSEMNETEVLFNDAYQSATRGGKSQSVSNNMEATTYSISFQIQE